MIDIHSHLIFEVDDGASCLEESIRMINAAKKQNVNIIIATPHFYNGIFHNDAIIEKYELLYERAMDYGMDLRLGNEILVGDDMLNIIKTNNPSDAEYMLIELPFSASFEDAESLVSKLSLLNLKIIIAHPERNRKVMKKFNEFIKLTYASKCLIQIDAASVLGVYGFYVRDIVRQMLKLKAVRYMASNAHCSEDYATIFPAAVKKLFKLCGEAYAYTLLESDIPRIMNVEGGASYGRKTS